jgi:hypothetical protein
MLTTTTGKSSFAQGSNYIMTVNSGMAAESQASQILRNALQPGSQEEDSIHNSIPVDDSGADSPSSSSYPHSAPHYHYHGLAATQTQSQQYDDESSVNEGSQKENVNASREALSSGNQIQGPPNAVSLIHNPGKSALSENPCHSPTKVSFDLSFTSDALIPFRLCQTLKQSLLSLPKLWQHL